MAAYTEICFLQNSVAWLWPMLELCGIALQICALIINRRWLLWAGLTFALGGAVAERDLTLAVGDTLAAAGLWLAMKKYSPEQANL